jgi:hypothetical protein
MAESWGRFEPEYEVDGETVYGQRLVVRFDPDWQDFSLGLDPQGGLRFELHLPPDMADDLPRMLEASRGPDATKEETSG